MLLLYDHPLSPYAQKCRIALREKGIAFEARLPTAIGSGAGMEPAFTAASPRAEVPALVDGEVRVFDSTIILEYIEERWPKPRLLPRVARRARARAHARRGDGHALRADQLGARRDPLLPARDGRAGEDASASAAAGRLPRGGAGSSAQLGDASLVRRRRLRLGRPLGRALSERIARLRHAAGARHAGWPTGSRA